MVFINFFEKIMDYSHQIFENIMEYLYFLPIDLHVPPQFKNNLTQTRSFEFSDPTEIGGILIPFPSTKSLL